MGIILEELDKNDGHFSFWHFQLLTLSKHSDSIVFSYMPIFFIFKLIMSKKRNYATKYRCSPAGGGETFLKTESHQKPTDLSPVKIIINLLASPLLYLELMRRFFPQQVSFL